MYILTRDLEATLLHLRSTFSDYRPRERSDAALHLWDLEVRAKDLWAEAGAHTPEWNEWSALIPQLRRIESGLLGEIPWSDTDQAMTRALDIVNRLREIRDE